MDEDNNFKDIVYTFLKIAINGQLLTKIYNLPFISAKLVFLTIVTLVIDGWCRRNIFLVCTNSPALT